LPSLPLHRVNSSGQVVCILCKVIVKGDWNLHAQAKTHKEVRTTKWLLTSWLSLLLQGLILLKQAKERKQAAATLDSTATTDEEAASKKRARPEVWLASVNAAGITTHSFFQQGIAEEPQSKRPKTSDVPTDFFDNPQEGEAIADNPEAEEGEEGDIDTPKFNPEEIEREVMQEAEPEVDEDDDVMDKLPAGFFDNEPAAQQRPKRRVVRRPAPTQPINTEKPPAEFATTLCCLVRSCSYLPLVPIISLFRRTWDSAMHPKRLMPTKRSWQ